MNTALMYLALASVFTALMWVPYVLDRMFTRGLFQAVGYPADPKPQAAWAQRLMKAHANAIENLVVFASLVLIAQAAGLAAGLVASAAIVYFWARVVHAVAFTFAVPWVRTLAFFAGFLAQMAVGARVLGLAAG